MVASFFFPLALLGALLVGCSIGLILTPIAALYHDVSRGMQLALRFGFFLTPVIFPLPEAGLPRMLMLLNPVTPILVSGRAWLTGSGEAMPTVVFCGCRCLPNPDRYSWASHLQGRSPHSHRAT